MPAFAHHDETIRVPRLMLEQPPARRLDQQFAPVQPARNTWAWLLLGFVLGLAAVDRPIDVLHHAQMSAHAQQLLRALDH